MTQEFKDRRILIIDDEANIRDLLSRILTLEGFKVTSCADGKSGIEEAAKEFYHAAIVDVILPDMNGIDLVRQLKKNSPDTELIVMTAFASVKDGVEAIRIGAFDYFEKGKDEDEIIRKVIQASAKAELSHKIRLLEDQLRKGYSFSAITGKSKAISEAVELAKKVAVTDTAVLLLGETGTGKELFARAIHESSKRRGKAFVAINCSAIPKDLQESELFGYVKGAFTGALKDKKGFFEEADGGTIFLDEIGDMSFETQAKLLRVLESNSFSKVGDSRITTVDVRVISATNKDLNLEIEKGNFKNDLYYRLNAFEIFLPPLRERKDDLELLVQMSLRNFCTKLGREVPNVSDDFISKLKEYAFPGNVRELKNIIERAVIIESGNELSASSLPEELFESRTETDGDSESLYETEKRHILKIYSQYNRNKSVTAEKLGIGTVTLYRKLKEYGAE